MQYRLLLCVQSKSLFLCLFVLWFYILSRLDISLSFPYFLKFLAFSLSPVMAYFSVRILAISEIFLLLKISLLVVGVFSLALVFFHPDIGVSEFARGDGWSGIYAQKSSLGRMMLLLVLISCLVRMDFLLGVLGAFVGMYVLMNTNSRASLYSLPAIFFFLCVVFFYSRNWLVRASLWIVFVSSSVWALVLANEIIHLDPHGSSVFIFGHGFDLTGRLEIWTFLIELIRDNILFGVGFDGLWQYSDRFELIDLLGWRLTDAHNGYLEVLLQLGLVGFFLFAVVFSFYASSVWYLYKANDQFKDIFVAIFIFIVLINIVSSHFLEVFSPVNFFMYMTIFYRYRLVVET